MVGEREVVEAARAKRIVHKGARLFVAEARAPALEAPEAAKSVQALA